MKIAMFTDTYEPQINGVVTSINVFGEELRRLGNEVHIFCPKSDGLKKDRFIHAFSSIDFRGYAGYKIAIPYSLLTTKMDFDIIHVHTPASAGLAGLTASRIYKIPAVGSFHTLISEYAHYLLPTKNRKILGLTKKSLWKYTSMFYNKFDEVIAPSEQMKRALKFHGVAKKISIIPTGIKIRKNRKLNKKALRKKHGLSGKIVLHVGRITKEKNISLIIDSIQKIDDVTLVIASDGPMKEYYQDYVKRKGLEGRVIFTGFIPATELAEYYSMADLFVMASRSETQGLVLIEALLYDLPILVLDCPVIGEFVKENDAGHVAKRDKFPKAMKKMLSHPCHSRNRIETLEKYDIKKCTREMLDVYQRLRN